MKLDTIRIKNLRSFKDETVHLSNYTCLVGPNGSGKSTVLCALNIFFRETEYSGLDGPCLTEDDFHHRNTSEPVEITATFTNLSSEAQEDLREYYRQGKLVISARADFDSSRGQATVKQFGQRLAMKAFAPYFKAVGDGARVSELKAIYAELRKVQADLPDAKTKEQMSEALQAYEAAHPAECELIPSEDEFYGFTRGANRLGKYVQWVFVPAVKDAREEQSEGRNSALGKLLARTVRAKVNFAQPVEDLRKDTLRRYEEILTANQSVLDEVSQALHKRLGEWSHPGAHLRLAWQQHPDKGVSIAEPFAQTIAGEGLYSGTLSRFGHGLQRSYLLALLHELAGCDDPSGPRLLLACEEPELYQHPPQARHLANVFRQLSTSNAQIMIATHNPVFVSGTDFEGVRMVRKELDTCCAKVSMTTAKEVWDDIQRVKGKPAARKNSGTVAKIHQELQAAINEMFFTNVLVLVEGIEDVAYLTSYMQLTGKSDSLRRLGCHIVPCNGKSHIAQPLAIAKRLQIPVFVMFDADGHEERPKAKEKHEVDNTCLLALTGTAEPQAFPSETFWADDVVMWNTEIGKVVAEDFDSKEWAAIRGEVEVNYGQIGDLEKNALFISDILAAAWEKDMKSKNLIKACASMIAFAQKHAPSAVANAKQQCG